MSLIETARNVFKIARDPYAHYLMGVFTLETLCSPGDVLQEWRKFVRDSKTSNGDGAPAPNFWLHHSHTPHSDGVASISDIVDVLLDRRVRFWSPTDHAYSGRGNFGAFDELASGTYDLNVHNKSGRSFQIDMYTDGRSLTVTTNRDESLTIFRSTELWTREGEILVHGFSGQFPKVILPSDMAVEYAVERNGLVVLPHVFYEEGLAYRGEGLKTIKRAKDAGASAVDVDALHIAFGVAPVLKSMRAARQCGLHIVASADAHQLFMYQNQSGISVLPPDYDAALLRNKGNPADALFECVRVGAFQLHRTYLSVSEFMQHARTHYEQNGYPKHL